MGEVEPPHRLVRLEMRVKVPDHMEDQEVSDAILTQLDPDRPFWAEIEGALVEVRAQVEAVFAEVIFAIGNRQAATATPERSDAHAFIKELAAMDEPIVVSTGKEVREGLNPKEAHSAIEDLWKAAQVA